jgi:DNA-binding response OmpR family regulator
MTITSAIVEDNRLIAEFPTEALSDEGYAVRVFGDNRSAFGDYHTAPCVGLARSGLPSMSGVQSTNLL